MDAALALGKPFAVVPCCVFPELSPDRRKPDGGEVRAYVDFIEYLRAKDPRDTHRIPPLRGTVQGVVQAVRRAVRRAKEGRGVQ